MTSLLIKDLSLTQRLDRAAAAAVRGGIYRFPDPGVAPGGCTTWPWPLAGTPALPAMPDWPTVPADPFFPPCGYNPVVIEPQGRIGTPTNLLANR